MRELYRSIAKHRMKNRGITKINKPYGKSNSSFFALFWKREVKYQVHGKRAY